MDSRWIQLQTELRDLAFVLDRQGSHVAADLACTIAARIDELHDAQPAQLPDSPPAPKPRRLTHAANGLIADFTD